MEPQSSPAPNINSINNSVPTTSPPPEQNIPQQVPITKKNPPIAVQILYAFGFIGLILGLLGSVILVFVGSTTTTFTGVFGSFGFNSLNIKVAGIIYGLITIGLFMLVNFMRAGKKWALTAYTILTTLFFISSLYGLLSHSGSHIINMVPYIILGLLLATLWTRDRAYFS